MHKDLPEETIWLIVLPPIWDVMVNAFAKGRYRFAFPFCPNCPPEGRYFSATRIDKHLSVFRVSCQGFLDAFPPMPAEVAAEKNLSWFRRKFRGFYR